MSETAHYKGKLIKIHRKKSIEETCKEIILKQTETNGEKYDSYQEALEKTLFNKYIITHDDIFKIEKKRIDPVSDTFIAIKDDDGNINFEVKYYIGCYSFSEAVEEAVDKNF